MSDFAAAPGSEPAERVTDNGRRTPAVLVIDDEADLRELISLTIVAMGFDVDAAESLGQARALLAGRRYALCLSDIRLTDGNGLELLREVVATGGPPVAMMTAYGSAENAVAALKAGAFDYLSKPVDLAQLRLLVRSVLDPQARAAAAQAGQSAALERMIGETPAMRALRVLIGRLGMSMAPVAVYGESGSGKELVARAIHEASARRAAPFVAVNCGAIPENLMEAEFFGYRRGAFTGADRDRDGFFQAAAGGTLFLDEVAELPLPMQVKLLRAIQERRVRKVGATGEEPVDVRLISATHQDLARLVVAGRFRQDLFYRLNVIEVARAEPARARRRHPGARRAHPRTARAAGRRAGAEPRRRRDRRAARLSVPRQRARARKRARASHRACGRRRADGCRPAPADSRHRRRRGGRRACTSDGHGERRCAGDRCRDR